MEFGGELVFIPTGDAPETECDEVEQATLDSPSGLRAAALQSYDDDGEVRGRSCPRLEGVKGGMRAGVDEDGSFSSVEVSFSHLLIVSSFMMHTRLQEPFKELL